MTIDSTDSKYMTIYDKKGHLVYEGNTYQGKACGYGPNPPKNGEFYSTEGKLIYSGEFKIYAPVGPGYPFVRIPEGYGNIPQSYHPQIPVITWEYGTVLEVVNKDV